MLQANAVTGLSANRSAHLIADDYLQLPKTTRLKLDRLAQKLGRKPADLVVEAVERMEKVGDMSRIELRDAVAEYYRPIGKSNSDGLTGEQRSIRATKAAKMRWAAVRARQLLAANADPGK